MNILLIIFIYNNLCVKKHVYHFHIEKSTKTYISLGFNKNWHVTFSPDFYFSLHHQHNLWEQLKKNGTFKIMLLVRVFVKYAII